VSAALMSKRGGRGERGEGSPVSRIKSPTFHFKTISKRKEEGKKREKGRRPFGCHLGDRKRSRMQWFSNMFRIFRGGEEKKGENGHRMRIYQKPPLPQIRSWRSGGEGRGEEGECKGSSREAGI